MTAIHERALEAARAAWLESMSDYTGLDKAIRATITAYLQALRQGWVLVPKEPTPGMRVAGRDALRSLFDSSPCEADAADTYRAMLAAAGGRDDG